MSYIDMMLSAGNLDLTAGPVPTPDVITGADAAALIESNQVEIATTEIITRNSDIEHDQRIIDKSVDNLVAMDNLQASMEMFKETGLSPRAAALIASQFSAAMSSVNKEGGSVASGLEDLGDDSGVTLLSDGLLAIEEEKKGILTRAIDVIKKVWESITTFFGNLFDQGARYKTQSANILKGLDASMAPAKVTIKDRALLMGRGYTTSPSSDYTKFAEFIKATLETHMNHSTNWMTTDVKLAIGGIIKAKTPAEAGKHMTALNSFTYKGATTKVKETNEFGIYRSEIYLGNYAVFVQKPKGAASATSAEQVLAALNGLAKYRITIKQATGEVDGNGGEVTINSGDIKAMLGNVDSLMDIVKEAKDKRIGKLGLAVTNMIGSLKSDMNAEADADMKKIHNAAFRIPVMANNVVADIPRGGGAAAMAVTKAILSLCEKAAKGKAGADDKGKDDKGGKKED